MDTPPIDPATTISHIKYILNNIEELNIQERIECLQLLVDNVKDECINEKGRGILVQFRDIPKEIIQQLFELIERKVTEKKAKLIEYTRENIIPA